MTLSAPTRLGRRRGFRPAGAAPEAVLMVDFTSPEGRTWWAVGVGDTVADAIAFARDSCPTGTSWQPRAWNDLYGD